MHQDRCDEHLFYTGADDCTLKMWDERLVSTWEENTLPRPCVAKCNIFEGGVCCILSSSRFPANQVLCSSYDERIYALDKRNLKRSVSQSEKLGGGVWKMKLHSSRVIFFRFCCDHDQNKRTQDLTFRVKKVTKILPWIRKI